MNRPEKDGLSICVSLPWTSNIQWTATHSNTHAEPSAFEDDTPQLGIFKPRPSPRSKLGSKTASARKASAKPGKPGAAS